MPSRAEAAPEHSTYHESTACERQEDEAMTTAIIGTGNIGGQVARHLVAGAERVVLAAREDSHAAALANELGPLGGGSAKPIEATRPLQAQAVSIVANELISIVRRERRVAESQQTTLPTLP